MESEEHQKGKEKFKEGKYEEAIELFKKCHKKEQRAPFYSNISACYMKLKDIPKAIKYARKSIEETPEFEKGYYRLINAGENTREYNSSVMIAEIKLGRERKEEKYWKEYYSGNEEVEVKRINLEYGKGVFSKKRYQKEEIIMKEIPIIQISKIEDYYNCCGFCLKTLCSKEPKNKYNQIFKEINKEEIIKCKCGMKYCNFKCQQLDYTHSLLCNKLKGLINYCKINHISHPLCIAKIFATILISQNIEKSLFPFVVFHSSPLIPFNSEIVPFFLNIFGSLLLKFNIYGGWTFIYQILYSVLKYNSSSILPLNPIQSLLLNNNSLLIDNTLLSSSLINHPDITAFTVEAEGLFKYLNTLNHSCSPNCFLANTDDSFALSLIASCPISPGDELTISYIDNTLPYSQRQSLLYDSYHFYCHCPKCNLMI
ncbi:set and mynd domain containing protein, putative [Entamoeba dispar SAW760]|uniref:Set and mynd domain containing protein, putative n=2 Tax=Entamoeba dispar (strain ATCC PRA-260 / SAW760) TaxID=370354 RepID=B0E8D6_ENTDS|nr:set and mynd domain containing protein, putative [Entamoeba dispar SAW760]EDR29210.1 set and mynd domain containing protein, putative [Entamoeba dispar SAW760]|eukprot:EDR29210.1 set and mynd domain containing protein, putative [Entamoeba dispar SAW760]